MALGNSSKPCVLRERCSFIQSTCGWWLFDWGFPSITTYEWQNIKYLEVNYAYHSAGTLLRYVHTWRLRLLQLNSFLTFYIDAILNVDANANVKCEHTIKMCSHPALAAALTLRKDNMYLQLYYSDRMEIAMTFKNGSGTCSDIAIHKAAGRTIPVYFTWYNSWKCREAVNGKRSLWVVPTDSRTVYGGFVNSAVKRHRWDWRSVWIDP